MNPTALYCNWKNPLDLWSHIPYLAVFILMYQVQADFDTFDKPLLCRCQSD